MSLRFHLVASEVDSGNEYFMCKRVGTNIRYERFSFDLLRVVKKGCALEVECMRACVCVCVCVCVCEGRGVICGLR